jgi:hypothetical protein
MLTSRLCKRTKKIRVELKGSGSGGRGSLEKRKCSIAWTFTSVVPRMGSMNISLPIVSDKPLCTNHV